MSCHEVLQEKGHRLTPQRMLVIEALHNADKHISAEEIYKQLHRRYPYANKSIADRDFQEPFMTSLLILYACATNCNYRAKKLILFQLYLRL